MYLYTAEFGLSQSIKDDECFAEAKKYLEEEIEIHFDNKNVSMIFLLKERDGGVIEVKSSSSLSEEERDYVSDQIRGQASDGLGEGFEQNEFAFSCQLCFESICNCECSVFDYLLEPSDYDTEEDYDEQLRHYEELIEDRTVSASFNWRKDSYKLTLTSYSTL